MVQRILAAVGRRRAGDDNWCRHLRGRRPQSAMTPVDNSLGSLARIGMTEPRQPRRSPGYAGGMGHAVTLRSARRTAGRRAIIKSSSRRWLHSSSRLRLGGQSGALYVYASPRLG